MSALTQASGAAEYGARVASDGHAALSKRASLTNAVDGLKRANPLLSAGTPHPRWQRITAVAVPALVTLLLARTVTGNGAWLAVLLSLPFVPIVLVRVMAIWHLMTPEARRLKAVPALETSDLPFYSVLVPLHRERDVAPSLVQALTALDYPADKLEILFITELHDSATRVALAAAAPPPHMHIVTVPAGLPQTKPRALNYALQLCTGEIVAVFDAEDVPHPRQLRLAAETFAAAPDDLVCVQARLGIYNTEDGFLARQFALEYESLFGAILPALERLGLPILLGGTSNHFRRKELEALGAWDPYNVTEDADLGIRLSRSERRVAMIDTETMEEAPADRRAWRGQRTRWLKGWMQTYLVHMREPGVLLAKLGLWRFMGVQIVLGGMILSALMHPWFYGLAAVQLYNGQFAIAGESGLWLLCWFNLAAGYAGGIVLGMMTSWRSEGRLPLIQAVLVPIYWLAISFASYRALAELVLRPYHWEKTPHTARPLGTGL